MGNPKLSRSAVVAAMVSAADPLGMQGQMTPFLRQKKGPFKQTDPFDGKRGKFEREKIKDRRIVCETLSRGGQLRSAKCAPRQ